jgi:hypothetical protein
MMPMAWPVAMMGILLLFGVQWLVDRAHFPSRKLRTWAALFGAWLAGAAAVEWTGDFTPELEWILTDAIAAIIVIVRPAGMVQKAIGLLFAGMVAAHVGHALGGHGEALYLALNAHIGWVQWVLLLVWSAGDVGSRVYNRTWRRRAVADPLALGRAGR